MIVTANDVDVRQFCTFHVADLFLGVNVLDVQEVLQTQALTPVPLAPPEVFGLINLRGQIVTAIDLRTKLGIPPARDDEAIEPLNVVVRTRFGDAVSLLVDEIGDVMYVRQDAYEEPPPTLSAAAQDVIRGVFKLQDRLLLELDTERAIGIPDGV